MCGIGGRTIEEAQSNISYEEFGRWVAYRNKRGNLNIGMRIEHDISIIAQMIANRYRKEGSEPFTMYDFALHHDRPPEKELTKEDLRNWA